MNRQNVLEKVSQLSEMETADCDKVLKALEKVLEGELHTSENMYSALNKLYKLIGFLRSI